MAVVEEDSSGNNNNSGNNEEEDKEDNTNVVYAAERIYIFSFGTQMYLGSGRTVAAQADTIDGVSKRKTKQMILVVHNVVFREIHTLFPKDVLGLDKTYIFNS